MDRRTACLTLAAVPLAAARAARAQSPRSPRIAWVSIDRIESSTFLDAFRQGMREVGYVEGRNLILDTWWGDGSQDKLRKIAPEMVASRPDVVVTQGGLSLRPMIETGVTLPIVTTYSGDPVLGRIVESYARPGGNRTGVTFFALELLPKRLELVKEVVPTLKRVAILGWPQHAGEPMELEAAIAAANRLGLAHQYHPISAAADLDTVFGRIARWNAEAILAFADGITASLAEPIAAFAIRQRIPSVSGWATFAEKGNLMTYGPALQASYHRLASFVDRILKGAKPGDLPFERPTTHELVINLRTAKAIGLAIPQSVLLRANQVIE